MGVQLTHTQAVNRLADIEAEFARLAEKEASLAEGERLSKEDKDYWDGLKKEWDEVDDHRSRLERAADLSEVNARKQSRVRVAARNGYTEAGSGGGAPRKSLRPDIANAYDRDAILDPDSIEDRRFKNPFDLSEMRTYGRDPREVTAELRSRAFAAIEQLQGATDGIREAATGILDRFDDKEATIARMVLATGKPAYLRGWSKMARNEAHLLKADEVQALDEVRAMSLTPSGGGYLVPFQLDPTVIVTANGSNNEIRRISRNVVATGNRWNGVTAGLVSWSWDAEATPVSDDSPSFAQPFIDIFMARGFVPISIEALEDEENVTANVAMLLAGGREVLEAEAFTNGTGTGQPRGVINALTGTAAEVSAATADTFAISDVYNLFGSLPSRYARNATWLAHQLVYNRIRQFDTAGGAGLWTTLGNGTPEQLIGRPAVQAENMTGSITAAQNNRILVFGDFQNYVIADRIGMTVEFLPHLFDQATGMPKGQRGWFAYYRTGAGVVNSAAFRMLNA